MIHEIPLDCHYHPPGEDLVHIGYILVKETGVWLWVRQRHGKTGTRFLCRLECDQVVYCEGYLFIQADNLNKTLEAGYVLGSRYEVMQPKYYDYEPPQRKAQ